MDAFRRELLPDEEQGLGSAIHVNAYRVSGMVPGALSLILADMMSWSGVFWVTAAFMLPGLICTLVISEPKIHGAPPKTIREAVVLPFTEFIGRAGWKSALFILSFIFLYKLGDSLATALATKFYLGSGIYDDPDRRDCQDNRILGKSYRRPFGRHMDNRAGNQPGLVGLRRRSGAGYSRIFMDVAGRPQSDVACRRDRFRGIWRQSRYSRVCGLYCNDNG